MLNKNMLRGKMVEKGMNTEKLASVLGINPSTFHRKVNGISDFTRCEIQIMRNCLALTNDDIEIIFFAEELADMQETTPA